MMQTFLTLLITFSVGGWIVGMFWAPFGKLNWIVFFYALRFSELLIPSIFWNPKSAYVVAWTYVHRFFAIASFKGWSLIPLPSSVDCQQVNAIKVTVCDFQD